MKEIDLRPDYHKKWVKDSHSGIPLIFLMGLNDSKKVNRLIELSSKFKQHEEEVISIGKEINEEGGFKLMQKICVFAIAKMTETRANQLINLWDGIGEWER